LSTKNFKLIEAVGCAFLNPRHILDKPEHLAG